jgi:hypothetical protein
MEESLPASFLGRSLEHGKFGIRVDELVVGLDAVALSLCAVGDGKLAGVACSKGGPVRNAGQIVLRRQRFDQVSVSRIHGISRRLLWGAGVTRVDFVEDGGKDGVAVDLPPPIKAACGIRNAGTNQIGRSNLQSITTTASDQAAQRPANNPNRQHRSHHNTMSKSHHRCSLWLLFIPTTQSCSTVFHSRFLGSEPTEASDAAQTLTAKPVEAITVVLARSLLTHLSRNTIRFLIPDIKGRNDDAERKPEI